MNVLGIIPARGGSKGVPGKNTRMLGGKPLIAYTIEAAEKSRLLTRFVVSTEDSHIAAVAKEFGAEVVRRPLDLAQDTTPMPPVVQHALLEHGAGVDLIVLLQPTCPQRKFEDIDAALSLFGEKSIQTVMSVYQVEDHHPARMYRVEEGRLAPLFPELSEARRQDLPAVYHRNGAIYACRRESFERTGLLWDGRPCPYVMPRNRSLNIDDPLDFQIAELLAANGQL
jgi:CMP-N,N'-diacetyllegionaminic acid synthase